ncbi:MAG: hypothetical protein GXP03_07025 [Alphaproteobacteria bacterium]|nr:hypothetical protein [Alphaproteobacteria bacterium]
MTAQTMTNSLKSTLSRLVQLFREDQSTDYIASEFLVSYEFSERVPEGTKFARAYALGEDSIKKDGFDWWKAPKALTSIVEFTRREIERADDEEAARILESLLDERDPQFLAKVNIH